MAISPGFNMIFPTGLQLKFALSHKNGSEPIAKLVSLAAPKELCLPRHTATTKRQRWAAQKFRLKIFSLCLCGELFLNGWTSICVAVINNQNSTINNAL